MVGESLSRLQSVSSPGIRIDVGPFKELESHLAPAAAPNPRKRLLTRSPFPSPRLAAMMSLGVVLSALELRIREPGDS